MRSESILNGASKRFRPRVTAETSFGANPQGNPRDNPGTRFFAPRHYLGNKEALPLAAARGCVFVEARGKLGDRVFHVA